MSPSACPDGKIPREDIVKEVAAAKRFIHEWEGLGELTVIEGVHLRRIVESVLEDRQELDKASQTGRDIGYMSVVPGIEAAERWANELYGLSFGDLNQFDDVMPEGFRPADYFDLVRDRAHKP